MRNGDGQEFKVSGHVTHTDPPNSVGFTWAWHGDEDARGHESHVTLAVVANGTGSRLILDHRGLDDSEQAARHEGGWTSSLSKLTSTIS
ncbi:MAG: SRPBCC family protein [Paracoccaceae bacterium]